jgi:hypothetical protein
MLWPVNSAAATLAWSAGWIAVLVGIASGAALGLGFAREDFLGGYGTWRRRLLRLGHIACIALGVLQMLFALSPASSAPNAMWTAGLWLTGNIAMPLVCALAAWKPSLRALFPIPVLSLFAAAALTLVGVLDRS